MEFTQVKVLVLQDWNPFTFERLRILRRDPSKLRCPFRLVLLFKRGALDFILENHTFASFRVTSYDYTGSPYFTLH